MIEPAVALGIKPKTDEWPPIKRYDELMVEKLPEPEILIAGILHQGGKLLLGGGSKSFKSWHSLISPYRYRLGGCGGGNSVSVRRCCSLTFRSKSGVSVIV